MLCYVMLYIYIYYYDTLKLENTCGNPHTPTRTTAYHRVQPRTMRTMKAPECCSVGRVPSGTPGYVRVLSRTGQLFC